MVLLALCVVSFLISLGTVALLKDRFGQLLLDIPNERSSHTQPTPRGGGLGFIVAFASSSAIALTLSFFTHRLQLQLELTPQQWLFLWLTLLPLVIIGIIDDRKGVKASIRYLVQITSAAIAVTMFHPFPQPWLSSLGSFGTIFAFVLTLIGFTALINFYNFMDGLDGLVAGVSVVQMSFLAIVLNEPFLWVLVAALLGFLWWNWSPAKIFMGDAGSTMLGAMIAIALLLPNQSTAEAWSSLAITFPLIGDAIYTLARRLLRGDNIFQAHRTHVYQRLQKQGWSHQQTALSYMSLTVVSAILITLWGLTGAGITLIVVVGAIALGEIILDEQNEIMRRNTN